MSEKKRTCLVCRTKYDWCNHCSSKAHDREEWKNIYCSENCKDIFDIVSAREFNHIGSLEAKTKLQSKDLSGLEGFREDLKKIVKDILNTPEEKKEIKSSEEKEKVNNNNSAPFINKHKNNPKEIVK